MEVARTVRKAVGQDFPVTIRIGGAQMTTAEGYGLDVTCRLAAKLEAENLIDAVAVIGGWHESRIPLINYYVPEGAFAQFGGAFKQTVKVPVLQSVRIDSRETAQKILDGGFADIIGVARPFWADAEFGNKIQNNESFNPCQACNKACIEASFKKRVVSCVFNPEFGYEYQLDKGLKSDGSQKILVVGGGPGGLYAARTAAKRGFKVVLCEQTHQLGGRLNIAALPPKKEGLTQYVQNIIRELVKLNVEIRLGQKVDFAYIKSQNPDYVIVATGADPLVIPIEGVNGKNVLQAEDVLQGSNELIAKIKHGKTVIIGGGSVGLETADFISARTFFSPESESFFRRYSLKETGVYGGFYIPADITVVEMGPKMGRNMGGTKGTLMTDLKERGVKLLNNVAVQKIEEDRVITKDADDNEVVLPADIVILASGYRAKTPDFVEELEKNIIPYKMIGDAVQARDFMSTISEAFHAFHDTEQL